MTTNSSNAKRKYDNAMPSTDEGWWESVLAEERLHASVRPPQVAVQKPRPVAQEKTEPATEAMVQPNWDEVQELYANDLRNNYENLMNYLKIG